MPYHMVVAAVELKANTPEDVIQILKARTGYISYETLQNLNVLYPISAPMNSDWSVSLSSLSTLTYDIARKLYYLTIRFQTEEFFKIEPFLCWIAAYSRRKGVVGYSTIPPFTPAITLIYFENDEAFWIDIGESKQRKMRQSNL